MFFSTLAEAKAHIESEIAETRKRMQYRAEALAADYASIATSIANGEQYMQGDPAMGSSIADMSRYYGRLETLREALNALEISVYMAEVEKKAKPAA